MLSHAVVNMLMVNSVNAIRRVGTLLQDMAKKKAEEGKKEEDMHKKFKWYCETTSRT